MHIRHLLRIQSEYEIDVVTSHKLITEPITDSRVHYYTYKPELKVSKILDELNIDSKFRGGFWRYSLERLFAVTQHHQDFPQDSLIHLESDVLPLRNFPFNSFENLGKLAWSKVDSNRDVAAIVFSPSLEASDWLSEQMIKEVGSASETDDMRVLGKVSGKNPEHIDILPSLPSETSNLQNQKLRWTESELNLISSNFSKFDGIFDPAGIGIWLTGTDPRNYFGATRKFDRKIDIDSHNFVIPGNVGYSVNSENCLTFQSEGKTTNIYSLHIHSKNLKYFSEKFEEHLIEDVRKSRFDQVQLEFSVRVLLNLIKHNLEKGTFLQFLSWLPGLRRLKSMNFRKKSV